MAKIHLIGANGYIGSLLVNCLIAAGHRVDKATYRLPNIPSKSIDADIVIHLAAAGGGTTHKPRAGDSDPQLMRNVNLGGMNSLLSGIKKSETRILFISSTAVYGKFGDSRIVTERAKLEPVSVYGEHKVESEKILRNSDFDWVILRPCGIFGPSVGSRLGNSFLNVVTDNATTSGRIIIMGGDQKIDTLYLLDLIHVILRICSDEWRSRAIFNVAGEIVTVEKMILSLVNSMLNIGLPCVVNYNDFQEKPTILTDTKKLRQAFPKWDTTKLSCSMHSLLSAHLGH